MIDSFLQHKINERVKSNKKEEIQTIQRRKMKQSNLQSMYIGVSNRKRRSGLDESLGYHYDKYQQILCRTVERVPTSGYNVEDLIGTAKQLYYNSQAERPIRLDDDDSSCGQENSELPRPIGRKAVKNLRRKKNVDQLEAINLFVTEFNNLRKEQKEIAELEMKMVDERERLKFKAKEEQERRKVEARLEQERMRIAAKHEQEKVMFEKDIMLTDPNSIPSEEGRAWVKAQQKIILERLQRGNED
ncbi:hypothetical protein Dimus_011677 [Dionaea muscipula]